MKFGNINIIDGAKLVLKVILGLFIARSGLLLMGDACTRRAISAEVPSPSSKYILTVYDAYGFLDGMCIANLRSAYEPVKLLRTNYWTGRRRDNSGDILIAGFSNCPRAILWESDSKLKIKLKHALDWKEKGLGGPPYDPIIRVKQKWNDVDIDFVPFSVPVAGEVVLPGEVHSTK